MAERSQSPTKTASEGKGIEKGATKRKHSPALERADKKEPQTVRVMNRRKKGLKKSTKKRTEREMPFWGGKHDENTENFSTIQNRASQA